MGFDYADRIGGLSDEQRLHFYEVLAHNLIVSIRSVWSDESLADAEKVDRIKWINEILHRVTAKVWVLRLKSHEWTETDFADEIRHWVSQNQAIAGEVGWAIKSSYKAVAGPGDGRGGEESV